MRKRFHILKLTKSRPNRLQVCCITLASHFSFGSGGGVPAIGCGRGRVTRAAAVLAVGRLAEKFNNFKNSEKIMKKF